MQSRPIVPKFVPLGLFALAWCCASGGKSRGALPAVETSNDVRFEQQVHPLLKQYCLSCHSTAKQKGDLDLERFATFAEVKRHPKVWQAVAQQLADGEMPPKEKPQPIAAEHDRLAGWVSTTLNEIARARAGDPGPVVLRRLSNAEYTYTLRDLTGVASLEPAKEFPLDGAAGEGFMNTGQALVMSPSLVTKYFDAGKAIAAHAVLLPDGIRFSPTTSRRDWTNEILTEIRNLYQTYTDPKGGGEQVNIQGIVFATNEGGRLQLEKYLAATVQERDAMAAGKSIDDVARERGLSVKYLRTVIGVLEGKETSPLLDGLRARWKVAKVNDVASLTAAFGEWQKALWKFNSVGHIGKVGGPTAWMEPVSPLAIKQDVRVKVPESSNGKPSTLYLVASDAGDGNDNDLVVWQRPRLVAAGRPDIAVKDLESAASAFVERRAQVFADTAKYLAAASEGATNVTDAAQRHGVDAAELKLWLAYLGMDDGVEIRINTPLAGQIQKGGGKDFIRGWGTDATPLMLANSSADLVNIPGTMKPHSVAVHPAPSAAAVVGWRSPITGTVNIAATVTHAHVACGNGVSWSLELRHGAIRRRLATGLAVDGNPVKIGPFDNLAVKAGDMMSIVIGPRGNDHGCDLTAVDLQLTSGGKVWDLGADVSPDVLAGNPHADRFGNAAVWHFYTEPENSAGAVPVIPAASMLGQWLAETDATRKGELAEGVRKLLLSAASGDGADAQTVRQLSRFDGPLFPATGFVSRTAAGGTDLHVRAPSVLEISIPAEIGAGCELVTTGVLDAVAGKEGSVQLRATTEKPSGDGLKAGWPVVVEEGSTARQRFDTAFEAFRKWFPPALCYSKIVPVDEPVTLTLYHREDENLARLMLDDQQKAKLDRLWDELHYVSADALTLVDSFAQILEYASQDADPKVFLPMRGAINERAAAYRKRLIGTEPVHLDGVLEFASRAYRRPLTEKEKGNLRTLYEKLRKDDLPHEEAVRLVLARVLVAPAFLYRAEAPGPGEKQIAVTDWELASRLSYFLWSSAPDAELMKLAARGKLREPAMVAAQAKRMMQDERIRRLSVEFGTQWIHIHDFESLDEKSERHFPTFGALRGPMFEEAVRFFTDFFQADRSVLSLLDADHAFLNEPLAKHYGIPGVLGDQWRRVDGIKKFGRGGILGMAATLARQSGASRTSPILRGNWVAEVLLGDKLPRPPKDVPQLPEDEATETLTVRQLTEKHTSDPRCANCHKRIDAFGFTLESFDAIGRHRDRDLAGRAIDSKARVMDGTEIDGIDGLRQYLLTKRRDAFVKQFCRKLLGYALGRGVMLSDEPLLDEMQGKLKANDYRIGVAVEAIVTSPQFLDIRGDKMVVED